MKNYEEFLRLERIPHIWCTGCGAGIALKAMLRAIERMGWTKDDIAMVSGIGCSSRAPGYVDFNTLHTTHGRALPFATGVKLARPDLNVVVVTGDGDATAIGGNHFIHAARRNIDITTVVFNNEIYGMTGGQVSPTTPRGAKASTAAYGNVEPNFDIAQLAIAAGASFVARVTAYQVRQLDRFIEKGMRKRGFSVIEVLAPCPTSFGRRNKFRKPVDMLKDQKERVISVEKAQGMSSEELEGRIVTGVLADVDRQEYVDRLTELERSIHGT